MPDNDETGVRELDVDHVADLANLPLDEDEREEMEQACAEVLEALQLEGIDEAPDEEAPTRVFEDEATPWPEAGVEAILTEFPDKDGRQLSR